MQDDVIRNFGLFYLHLNVLFRWWGSTAWTTSLNRSITSLTWTVRLRRAGVTTTTRRTRTICTTCTPTWPSWTTCAGTETRHTPEYESLRESLWITACVWEQEEGLPHLCVATSLRGGGAYSSPGVWIHSVRKHLTRTAAQEGESGNQKSHLFRNQLYYNDCAVSDSLKESSSKNH